MLGVLADTANTPRLTLADVDTLADGQDAETLKTTSCNNRPLNGPEYEDVIDILLAIIFGIGDSVCQYNWITFHLQRWRTPSRRSTTSTSGLVIYSSP